MITGLQVDVLSAELVGIMQERLKYHQDKADVFEKNAAELMKTIKNIEEDMSTGKVSGGNPAEQLQTKAREHKEKATYYKFMIEHVIKNDTYRLSQEDLARLGITARYF